MKRLFYDIETSLGIYSAFGQTFQTRIAPQNEIIQPRIICICYKWEDENEVHSLEWDKGDDKKLIKAFVKELNKADESLGHNSDGFDLPYIRRRAIIHRIPMAWDYPTNDTLKLVRKRAGRGFKFESNRLDSIAKDLKVGKKIKTDYALWQRITFPCFIPSVFPMGKDYRKALDEMVKYCKMDVEVLEKVFQELMPYVKPKNNMAVASGDYAWNCKTCSSGNVNVKGFRTSQAGVRKKRTRCRDCGTQGQISMKVWRDYEQFKTDLRKFNIQL